MSKEMVVSANPHETRVAILEDGLVSEVFFERERSYSLAGSIYKGRVTRILPGMQSAFVNIGLERDAFLYVSDFLEGLEEYDQLVNSLEERTPQRGRQMEEPEPSASVTNTEMEEPAVAETVQQLDSPALDSEPEPSTFEPQPLAAIAPLPGESISPPARPLQADRPQGDRPQGERPQGDRNLDGGKGRDRGRFGRRGRRGGQRGRGGFPESKYAREGAPISRSVPPSVEPSSPAVVSSEPEAPVERILLPGESLAKYRESARASINLTEAPAPQTASEIAHGNVAVDAEYKRELEPPVVQIAPFAADDEQIASAPDAPTTFVSEPMEQEASELLIEPHAFVPRAFDPEAFEESDASQLTADALAAVSQSTLTEIKEDTAELGIEWESREEIVESGEYVPAAQGGELNAAEIAEALESEEADASESAENESSEAVASAENSASTTGEVREAAVREGGRNPRYQRRQRWQARRGGGARREGAPRDGAPRDGAQRDQGRRPQRSGVPQREGQRELPREGQRQTPRPLIGDMLKEGQEIIVQIAKEPLGKKGARITSHIALPGRYVVYMPTLNHVGVSRKVSSDEERQRLKRIVLAAARNFAGGFIVRTAGDGRSEEDVRQDVQYLTKLWLDIKTKAEKSAAPSLLHHDPDLVLRTLRDQLSPEYTTIWVDNEQVYEQILLMVQKFQPALVGRVRLYTKDVPLFEETGVQDEINKALKPKVWLKSGGYIVINQTEALVAIDVNTGKFVGKSNRLEDTIVKTNLEAIQEIVRQIRLRDLGGIIVIDFIDMDERKNRAKVMAELEEAVKVDRSPSKILSFNEFGLVAITRKRVRQSLERAICQPCAYCTGSGMVKSPATISLEILAEARKQAADLGGKQITIRVNPEVGKTLKSTAASIIDSIEETTGKGVIIRNDPTVHMENFYFD